MRTMRLMSKTHVGRLRAAARRGASVLDKHQPGWAGQIHLGKLSMRDCNKCVLGQLYGNYISGLDRLFRRISSSHRYGFNIFYIKAPSVTDHRRFTRASYQVLADEWKKLIHERRKKAA